jgi:hypothetical protein
VKVVEEGRREGEGQEVDVVFEFEGQEGEKEEGRGWTYHSVHDGQAGNPLSSLDWTTNPANVVIRSEENEHAEDNVNANGNGNGNEDAPSGYWAGFSPPTSPRMDDHGNTLPQGEDDYWASYGKSFTPGGVTPAQQTPNISRRPTQDQIPTFTSTSITNSKSTPTPTAQDGLLRSRVEMKIASLLRKLWISHLPTSDPELRALTFLSLARAVQSPSSASLQGGDESGTRERMEVLYEVYEVIEDGQDGFMRLVEKSLITPGGFGAESRQGSSAQLNYWE